MLVLALAFGMLRGIRALVKSILTAIVETMIVGPICRKESKENFNSLTIFCDKDTARKNFWLDSVS
jgi:hypothetical protein